MTFLNTLRARRLLAIVRGDSAPGCIGAVEALVDAGITAIEVSLTGRPALDVLAATHRAFGGAVMLGAGTIITPQQAQAAVEAGATYLVTPALTPGADEGVRLGVPVLMGALTPTEVVAAVDRGAAAVKLFPADLGGPSYLAGLTAPFPHVPFVPVGGIDRDAARAYLAAGALAVGIGSPLLGDAVTSGDTESLGVRARDFVAAVRTQTEDAR